MILQKAPETRMEALSRDKDSKIVLDLLASYGYKEVARLLLEYKADLWTADKYGNMLPHQVAIWGHEQVAQLLLGNYGASSSARNKLRGMALHQAAFAEGAAVVKLLIEKGAETSAVN